MKPETFRAAGIGMTLGVVAVAAGIALGANVLLHQRPADASPALVPAATKTYRVPGVPQNLRVLRYRRSESGSVTLRATIRTREPGWSVHSSCAGKPVAHNGECFIGARYQGHVAGVHDALIVVRMVDDAGKKSVRVQPVRVITGEHQERQGGVSA